MKLLSFKSFNPYIDEHQIETLDEVMIDKTLYPVSTSIGKVIKSSSLDDNRKPVKFFSIKVPLFGVELEYDLYDVEWHFNVPIYATKYTCYL